MPKRLISPHLPILPQIVHRHIPSLLIPLRHPRLLITTLSHIRTSHPLVGVRRLLDPDPLIIHAILPVAMRRPSAAAADADEPEEAGADAEGGGEPGCYEHGVAEGAVDAVEF